MENTSEKTRKPLKRKIKKIFKKENMWKVLVVVSSLALLSTSILPYLIK
jgi:hypothetical protein